MQIYVRKCFLKKFQISNVSLRIDVTTAGRCVSNIHIYRRLTVAIFHSPLKISYSKQHLIRHFIPIIW